MVDLNKVTGIYRTGMLFKSRGPFVCFCSNNVRYTYLIFQCQKM